MVSINYALREISCKIVYYGPGLSGKTTNLQFVHGKVPEVSRGELISLATEADRTLYFDFLPVDVGQIAGFATKFQLYTVPGQVFYDATRRLVLRGVDGLVFVADSQASKMDENIESLNNMSDNLRDCGIDADVTPLVFQWNKRDLPDILPVPVLEETLNPHGLPSFEAVATTGVGVFDTLKKITKLVLENARARAVSRPAAAPRSTTIPPVVKQLQERELVGVGVKTDKTPVAPSRRREVLEREPARVAPAAAHRSAPGVEREAAPDEPAPAAPPPESRSSQVYRAQRSLKVRQKRKSWFARLLARWLGD